MMKIEKLIGLITLISGIIFWILLFSNIQSLHFSDGNMHSEIISKMNYSKQYYSYFKMFVFGLLGVLGGIYFFKVKKIGWLLCCIFWSESFAERVISIFSKINILDAFFGGQTLFSLLMVGILISKTNIQKFDVDKKDWIKIIMSVLVLLLLQYTY